MCLAAVVTCWRHRRVKMLHYFYITCKKDGKVLDCDSSSRPTSLTALVTRSWNKLQDSQLWKWDCEGRLVCKAAKNLVADVKENNKAPGTPVILWTPTENSNQVWIVEGDVIKSGLNNLAMGGGTRISMAEPNSDFQRWEFVPEDLWRNYQKVLASKNPVEEADFWRMVAERHIEVIIGYNIARYEKAIQEAVRVIHQCADDVKKVADRAGIARTTDGVAGIAGGAALLGAFLAPLTGGLSLALTVAGATAAIGGGVATVSSNIAKMYLDKGSVEKLRESARPVLNATMCLHGFLSHYSEKLKAAKKYLETEEGKKFVASKGKDGKMKVVDIVAGYEYALGGVKLGFNVGSVTSGAVTGLASSTKVAAGIGTVGAKALFGSLAALGMVIGVWDVVGGVLDMNNGEETAKAFQQAADNLEEESSELIELFKQLSTTEMKGSKKISTALDEDNPPDYASIRKHYNF